MPSKTSRRFESLASMFTTAAMKGFRPLRKVLTAKSLALSVRWHCWMDEIAPVLAFGAWVWPWSHDVWRAINTSTIRLLRTMAGIPRAPDEPLLVWHMRSWRSCGVANGTVTG